MKTYFASIPAKTADDAVNALRDLEASQTGKDREVEIRQVITIGQKALVLYVTYERGTIQ